VNRPSGRLSLGIGLPNTVYSVCKLVDAARRSPWYLSVDAFVYAHISRRVSIVAVMIKNLSVEKIESRFCGLGPDDFEEVIEESKKNLKELGTPRTLVCQEGFENLYDAAYFVTSHLWAAPKLERHEAMGALEDSSEVIYSCFDVRP
jgi:hypothetical protein